MQLSDPEAIAYQDTAERHLVAARLLLNQGIYEVATFCCYHAYECSGCALLIAKGEVCGRTVHHAQKLQKFLKRAQTMNDTDMEEQIANLNGQISSLRNRLLYPRRDNRRIIRPNQEITQEQAEELLRDIKSVVEWVGNKIRS
jgi:AbiV family abortive infection protein